MIASNKLAEAAEAWIAKLSLKKNSGYPVDSKPNPGNIFFHPFLFVSNYIYHFSFGIPQSATRSSSIQGGV